MKRLKKMLVLFLCLAMVQVPVQSFSQPVEIQAAAKEPVKKQVKYSKGRYYYYENGKRVKLKNKWVTVARQKYYFGKNGYAYAAKREKGIKYNVIRKKIGSKYYGFDNKGRRVKKGLYCDHRGICYYFNSRGEYVAKETKKYEKLIPMRHPAVDKKSVAVARKVLDKLAKPIKIVKTGSSCVVMGATDYSVIYPHYELQYAQYNKTKEKIVTGIWAR